MAYNQEMILINCKEKRKALASIEDGVDDKIQGPEEYMNKGKER